MVNRDMVTPLHSLLGLDSFLLGFFSFKATTHVLSCLWVSFFTTVDLFTTPCIGIVVCLLFSLVPWILVELTYTPKLCSSYYNV